MKGSTIFKAAALALFPILVFVGLNRYFYGNFTYLGRSSPDLSILDSTKSLEGVLPVHFFKKEKVLVLGIWYEKIKSQEELIGKMIETDTGGYPQYLARKTQERLFPLKYKAISLSDIHYASAFYFAHSPYLVSKMDNETFPTSEHASGKLFVFKDANNKKIYALELESETENDFGTHETVVFQNDQLLYQHVRNIPHDADGGWLLLHFITILVVVVEVMCVVISLSRNWRRRVFAGKKA